MSTFDMPRTGAWEQRGGWVVNALVRDLHLPIENSAGLVGGLGGESDGFDNLQENRPTVPGSAGGRGWAQWTGYSAANNRRLLFETWCQQHGLDPDSDEGNYRYLVHELLTTEKAALARIRAANGIEDATRVAHVYYERSGDQSQAETNRRLVWARRALAGALGTAQPADPISIEQMQAAVMAVQLGLRLSGDYDGAIDGIAGKGTKAGLTAFMGRLSA